MKKILLFASVLCSSVLLAQQDPILTFNFQGVTGAPTSVQSNFNATGVAPSTISINTFTGAGGLNPSNSNNNFASTGFTTAEVINIADYIEFTVSPVNNYNVIIEELTLKLSRNQQGPQIIEIRTSLDNYSNSAGDYNGPTEPGGQKFALVNANTVYTVTYALNLSTFNAQNQTNTPINIRIYGYFSGNVNAGQLILGDNTAADDIIVSSTVDPISLPVNFADVRASKQGGAVRVSFANLTEEDVANYIIERSADGRSYQTLATLAPKANNNSRADYQYLDRTPLSGDNFYRIRAVESNGKTVYSPVVKVGVESSGASLVLYPNPAPKGSTVNLQLANLPAGEYTIRMFNEVGQVLGTKLLRHTGGSLTEAMPTSKSAGRYTVEVKGAVHFTQSFLLQ